MTRIRNLLKDEVFRILALATVLAIGAAPIGAAAYIALTIDLYSRVQ